MLSSQRVVLVRAFQVIRKTSIAIQHLVSKVWFSNVPAVSISCTVFLNNAFLKKPLKQFKDPQFFAEYARRARANVAENDNPLVVHIIDYPDFIEKTFSHKLCLFH